MARMVEVSQLAELYIGYALNADQGRLEWRRQKGFEWEIC